MGNFQKWLGEGAAGLLDPASKKPLALVRTGIAPVQKRALGGAKDSWETSLLGSKKPFVPPQTTFGDFPTLSPQLGAPSFAAPPNRSDFCGGRPWRTRFDIAPTSISYRLQGAQHSISSEVATKDHLSSNPPKGNPPELRIKADIS